MNRIVIVGALVFSWGCQKPVAQERADAGATPAPVTSTAASSAAAAASAAVRAAAAVVPSGAAAAVHVEAGAIYEAEALASQLDADQTPFADAVVTVRGRFAKSTLDAGFPLVYFTDISADASKPLEDEDRFACQGEFSPGDKGATFPKNTVILLTGKVGVGKNREKGTVVLLECAAKKDPAAAAKK